MFRTAVRGLAITAIVSVAATSFYYQYQPASVSAATPPVTGRGTGRFGNRDVVIGRLVSISKQDVSIQGFAGKQSIASASTIRFYQAGTTSQKSLAAGEKVTVRLSPSKATGPATSVTIAPSGNFYGTVQAVRAGGTRRPTGTPPPGGFKRGTGGFPMILAGTVTGVHGSTLTLKTAQGKTQSVSLNGSTEVYEFSSVASSKLSAGSTVAVTTATVSGHQVAVAVVGSAVANTSASLSTTP